MTLACSFSYEDVALVHMLHRVAPETDIFYLDTDLLFPETYETRDRLAKVSGKSFIRVRPESSLEEQGPSLGRRTVETRPQYLLWDSKSKAFARF